jgi:hypothetical protein
MAKLCFSRLGWVAALAGLAFLLVPAGRAFAATAAAASPAEPCHVTAVNAATIECGSGGRIKLLINDQADKDALARITPGSILDPVDRSVPLAPQDLKIAHASDSVGQIVVALAIGAVAALVYAWLVTGTATVPGRRPRILALVIGQDGRYSNSKLQAAGWMAVLLIAYVGTCWLRWRAGMSWDDATNVGLSDNLLAMAGLSAAAAAGAKLVTGTKTANAETAPRQAAAASQSPPAQAAAGQPPPAQDPAAGQAPPAQAAAGQPVLPIKTMGKPNLRHDLFKNDKGEWDVGDAQMVLVAAASILLFAWNVWGTWSSLSLAGHVDLPHPTDALTFAFGGSLGGYLAKKIGGTVGLS